MNQEPFETVAERFVRPLRRTAFFDSLKDAVAETPPDVAGIVRAFIANLQSIIVTCGSVYALGYDDAVKRLEARIERRHLPCVREDEVLWMNPLERKGWYAQYMHWHYEEEILPFIHSDDGQRRLHREIELHLREAGRNSRYIQAANDLLYQGTVFAWMAVEVMTSDLAKLFLDSHPTAKARLVVHQKAGDWFDRRSDLKTPISAKNMPPFFENLLPAAKNLHTQLTSHSLTMLSHSRHLIVHRRGVVDAEYIAKTGSTVPLGSNVFLTPADLADYLIFSRDLAAELVKGVMESW